MNKVFALLILAASLTLGFFQEWAKVGINYYLETADAIPGFFENPADKRAELMNAREVDAPFDYYYSHSKLHGLNGFTRSGIVALKWGLAVVLIVLNLILNYLILRFLLDDIAFVRRSLLWITVFAIGVIGIFLVGGKLVGAYEAGYNIARRALGFLHGPIPALFIWLASRLRGMNKTRTT